LIFEAFSKICLKKSSCIKINKIDAISMFHRAFFNSIMDKTPTHTLFTQHYISLVC